MVHRFANYYQKPSPKNNETMYYIGIGPEPVQKAISLYTATKSDLMLRPIPGDSGVLRIGSPVILGDFVHFGISLKRAQNSGNATLHYHVYTAYPKPGDSLETFNMKTACAVLRHGVYHGEVNTETENDQLFYELRLKRESQPFKQIVNVIVKHELYGLMTAYQPCMIQVQGSMYRLASVSTGGVLVFL
jgi:hypothetical protein